MQKNEAADFYNEVLPDYRLWSSRLNIHFGYYEWGMNPFSLENMLSEMNRKVAEALRVRPDESLKVLDAGCGAGATARFLAEAFPRLSITGVANSEKQISAGEVLNKDKGLSDRIHLLKADFRDIPLPGNSFHAAIAIESACYANGKDKSDFILEMARLLRPGGKLIVADGFKNHDRPLPPILNRVHKKTLRLWAMNELAEIGPFRNALSTSGFEKIKVKNISWNVAPSALHIPAVLTRIWWDHCFRSGVSSLQKHYPQALLRTFIMGFFIRHFGYYLISAEKCR